MRDICQPDARLLDKLGDIGIVDTVRRPKAQSRLGEAIKELRAQADLKQAELGAAVGLPQPRVSDWEGSTHLEVEEALDLLGRIDVACGRPRGTILKNAGFIDADSTVPGVLDAIDSDPDLNDAARDVMRESYRIYKRASQAAAAGPTPSPTRPEAAEELAEHLREERNRRLENPPPPWAPAIDQEGDRSDRSA